MVYGSLEIPAAFVQGGVLDEVALTGAAAPVVKAGKGDAQFGQQLGKNGLLGGIHGAFQAVGADDQGRIFPGREMENALEAERVAIKGQGDLTGFHLEFILFYPYNNKF